jgi:hypothetical protein
VIGDVAGNGLKAAVIMDRVRSALRAYALDAADPASRVLHIMGLDQLLPVYRDVPASLAAGAAGG